ncbi:mechanosensitive ion channel domain-containing protein [Hydrogenimonas sp.]
MRRIVLASLLLLFATGLWAQQRPDPAASSQIVEDAGPKPYALEKIPDAATEAASTFAKMAESLQESEEAKAVKKELPALLKEIAAFRKSVAEKPLESLSPQALRNLAENLQQYRRRLELYAEKLSARVDAYNAMLKSLDTLTARWEATRTLAKAQQAPRAIRERIREILDEAAALHKRLKSVYDRTLTAADTVSGESRELESLGKRVEEALAKRSVELFTLDSPPLWSLLSEQGFSPARYARALVSSALYIVQRAQAFYTTNRANLYAHLGTTLLLGLFIFYLRHRHGTLFPVRDDAVRSAMAFVEHPFAATLLLGVFIVPLFYSERPAAVGELNAVLALGALLAILRDLVPAAMRRYIYLLAALFVLTVLQRHMVDAPAEVRTAWLLLALAALAASVRMLRKEGPLRSGGIEGDMRFFARFAPLIPLVLLVAVGAEMVGAANLSVKLFTALMSSLVLFMIFFVAARIFRGLIVMFVRRRAIESKHLLQEYAHQIQSYLTFVVNLFLMAYWLYLVLKQFGVLFYVENWWHALMSISWQVGKVVVSVGSVVDFVLVLTVTWFLTRLITILLDLEIFNRYEFPRGVPAAIQMIVRYVIITVGVVFALTVLGIRLTDLSLIAGALGVGIGFGLRNIMANFVSGLLLIFERPVQQGDVVEVSGVFGDIEKIGVRATTIKTYDGSEVIVPNADFITKDVTNWTLSSKSRRIKMGYKVAFGNDPRRVIAIIRDAIAKHPEIRKDPAPKVLFEGYGDYYLEFTVYFWVDKRLLDVKSETALLIYEALTEAGVEMPVPFSRVAYRNQDK